MMRPTVQDLQSIESRVRASDEEDAVASIESSAAGRPDAEVALKSDNNNHRILWYQLSKLCPSKCVVLGFVDDRFVRRGLVDELPAWGANLIWLS